MRYAPKEVERHLHKASLISVRWCWWWFNLTDMSRPFSSMRIANALCVFAGPLNITFRRRWLFGPARQLHPEAFVKAGREDLL